MEKQIKSGQRQRLIRSEMKGKAHSRDFLTPVKHKKDPSVYPVQSLSHIGMYLHISTLKMHSSIFYRKIRKFLTFLIGKLCLL